VKSIKAMVNGFDVQLHNELILICDVGRCRNITAGIRWIVQLILGYNDIALVIDNIAVFIGV